MSRGMSVGGPATVTSMPSSRKPAMSLRATRLCRMSPTIQTLSAVELAAQAWRMVKRSSRHCEGCWNLPSPALITLACGVAPRASRQAPICGWRMTMMSG